jgi:hypothetical protein
MLNQPKKKNRMRTLKLFFLTVTLVIVLPITSQAKSKDSLLGDFEALQDIYEVTDGNNWHNNSGWRSMTPETMGEAYGVEVWESGPHQGRVRVLWLFDNGLINVQYAGGKPDLDSRGRYQLIAGRGLRESLGNLKQMEYIDIRMNTISGTIPDSFWYLDKLKIAALGFAAQTRWNGPDNDMRNLRHPYSAKRPYLEESGQSNQGAQFYGSIPSTVSNMTSLVDLYLERNYFDQTQIPAEIFQLPNLRWLYISKNGFTGSLPNVNLGPKVKTLSLTGGSFDRSTAEINASNGPHYYLSGNLPPAWGNSTTIESLGISFNHFTGGIPEEWAGMKNLLLFLAMVNFDLGGSFPNFFNKTNMPRLNTVHIERTNLTGSINSDFAVASNNAVFMVGPENNLSGELPDSFKSINHPDFPDRLIIWGLQGQNLEGAFTDDISSLNRIRQFWVHGNNFSGPLPVDYPKSTSLSDFNMSNNAFTGAIPATLGNMISPTAISLNGNNLTSYETGAISSLVLNGSSYMNGLRRIRTFRVNDNALSQSDLDQIILDLWANVQSRKGTTWENWGTNAVLDISNQSTGAGPSNTDEINSAIHNLESAGWSVNFDGDRTPQGEDSGSGDGDGETPPSTPTLYSPSNGANNVSLTPEFSWSNEGADYYRLRVNVSGSSTYVIDRQVDGTSFAPSSQLQYNTEYSWQVRSVKDGNSSSWSSSRRFTTVSEQGEGNDEGSEEIAAPVQVSPENNATDVPNSIRFEWNPVADANHYILHVTRADEQGHHTEFFYSDSEGVIITDTEYTVNRSTLPERVHAWRVRAVVGDVPGEWSPVWSFTTANSESILDIQTELNQNYPNPFNPSTQIRYTVSESQHVSLKVYDMAGRLVANLVDGETVNAGTYEVTFNANGLASGIYFYRFITEREIVTRKMTLMK